jgi:hypothetical protein
LLEVDELDFEGLSALQVRYAMVQSRVWKNMRYLIVRFSGVYRDGSEGNPDAKYMYAMAEAGIAAYDTDGVILDFENLSYQWGDRIEQVFSAGTARRTGLEPFPLAVIAGPGCAPALASLEWGIGTTRKATEMDEMFETLDEAVNWLDSFDRPDWEPISP